MDALLTFIHHPPTPLLFFLLFSLTRLLPVLSQTAPSLADSIFCERNNDCIETTFCCSTYACVHPSICLQGQKLYQDYCDYHFECLSRCCDQSKCSHFLRCYDKCVSNSDCGGTTNCCSEGYCTHSVLCKGNKVKGDYCDTSDECMSKFCVSNECQEESSLFTNKFIHNLCLFILVTLVSMTFLSCC